MARLALFLDEDVRVVLAEILRQRGYDVVHVLEVDRGGQDDPEQLAYAVSYGRAMLTHNIRHYLLLVEGQRSTFSGHVLLEPRAAPDRYPA